MTNVRGKGSYFFGKMRKRGGWRLVASFDIKLAGEDAYWITAPPSLSKRPHIVAFRNWLGEEAAADR